MQRGRSQEEFLKRDAQEKMPDRSHGGPPQSAGTDLFPNWDDHDCWFGAGKLVFTWGGES